MTKIQHEPRVKHSRIVHVVAFAFVCHCRNAFTNHLFVCCAPVCLETVRGGRLGSKTSNAADVFVGRAKAACIVANLLLEKPTNQCSGSLQTWRELLSSSSSSSSSRLFRGSSCLATAVSRQTEKPTNHIVPEV